MSSASYTSTGEGWVQIPARKRVYDVQTKDRQTKMTYACTTGLADVCPSIG